MKISNSNGPRILPWGTPTVTVSGDEWKWSISVICCRFDRYDLNQLIDLFVKPNEDIFFMSRLWSTVSNAFAKSKNTAPVKLPDSILLNT